VTNLVFVLRLEAPDLSREQRARGLRRGARGAQLGARVLELHCLFWSAVTSAASATAAASCSVIERRASSACFSWRALCRSAACIPSEC